MCGVVAVLGGNPRTAEAAVDAGLRALAHRGPDGLGTWTSTGPRTVALGHVRLATVALEDGAQPITNERADVVATCSGELYDYEETRRDLEARGHRFRSRGDCELIVHLYEEFGAQGCVSRLRGEFAFVLWDEGQQTLVAARDGFGVRPLVFSQIPGEAPGTWAFASEAKALFAMGVRPAWDDAALSVASTFQYPPAGATLFQGVQQVLPGEVLSIHANEAIRRRHISPPRSTFAGTFDDASEALRTTLKDAVTQRLRAEVPLAALLSGGLDSTAVAALAAQQAPGLPAYTVSFLDDAHYDEAEQAARTAAELGLDHRIVALQAADLAAVLPRAVAHSEGLSINHHVAAKYRLMERLRSDGITVALTGEGADELFFGYAHLRADAGVEGLAASNGASAGLMLPTTRPDSTLEVPDLGPIERTLGFLPTWVRTKASLGARIRSLMAPHFRERLDEHPATESFAASLAQAATPATDAPTRAAETWSAHALSGYILGTLSDRLELVHAVEGRPAFLDQRVADLARSLPTEFKIRGRLEKAVLRDSLIGTVPDAVRTREKHPFLAPPSAAGVPFALEQLGRNSFGVGGAFSRDAIAARLRTFGHADRSERAAWQPAIMWALSFSWLEDAYIDARASGGVA